MSGAGIGRIRGAWTKGVWRKVTKGKKGDRGTAGTNRAQGSDVLGSDHVKVHDYKIKYGPSLSRVLWSS